MSKLRNNDIKFKVQNAILNMTILPGMCEALASRCSPFPKTQMHMGNILVTLSLSVLLLITPLCLPRAG